jgi:hypothetical protein
MSHAARFHCIWPLKNMLHFESNILKKLPF